MHEIFRIYVYFLEESLVPHLRECLKNEVAIFMFFLRSLFLGYFLKQKLPILLR